MPLIATSRTGLQQANVGHASRFPEQWSEEVSLRHSLMAPFAEEVSSRGISLGCLLSHRHVAVTKGLRSDVRLCFVWLQVEDHQGQLAAQQVVWFYRNPKHVGHQVLYSRHSIARHAIGSVCCSVSASIDGLFGLTHIKTRRGGIRSR